MIPRIIAADIIDMIDIVIDIVGTSDIISIVYTIDKTHLLAS